MLPKNQYYCKKNLYTLLIPCSTITISPTTVFLAHEKTEHIDFYRIAHHAMAGTFLAYYKARQYALGLLQNGYHYLEHRVLIRDDNRPYNTLGCGGIHYWLE